MNSSTNWWSEPFPATGSQTASGIRRQLGKSELDPVNVLVREAVQNCWDARLPGHDPISVSFSLDRIGNRAVAWRRVLLGNSGSGPVLGAGMNLKSCLTTNDYVLTISDRRTTGLGGPLRANQPVRRGETANFVQFIRNVGEPRDQDLGGGTYGFGKSILYTFSKCSTILVRTRCPAGEQHPDRLIGASLGSIFEDPEGRRFTGRHWWGVVGEDDIPDPLLAHEVGTVSDELGIPPRDESTGTDVLIIAPSMDIDGVEGDPMKLGEKIVAAIIWNLWPKMGSARRRKTIDFTVSVDGMTIPIPELKRIPVLQTMSECLDEVHEMEFNDERCERRKSDPQVVGKLAMGTTPAAFPPAARLDHDLRMIVDLCPMTEPGQLANFRHVARMRSPELIVDYLPCTPFKLASIGYAGVYRASEMADNYFSESEPPTHDSWQPAGLSGTARGVVVGHKSFIKKHAEQFVLGGEGGASTTVQGLGRLASTLGAIIDTATGTAPSAPTGRGGGTRKSVKKARITSPARVVLVEGVPVLRATVDVPRLASMTVVTADTAVQIAGGGREREAPVGSTNSAVIRWTRPDNSDVRLGAKLFAQPGDGGEWIVEAQVVPDAAVRISVSQEEM